MLLPHRVEGLKVSLGFLHRDTNATHEDSILMPDSPLRPPPIPSPNTIMSVIKVQHMDLVDTFRA